MCKLKGGSIETHMRHISQPNHSLVSSTTIALALTGLSCSIKGRAGCCKKHI